MKKMTRMLTAIGLVLTTTLFTAFASNTYSSTAGTIRADQDKVTDLNYYTELQFNKGFGFTNLSTTGLQLGGATKVNDIYLGGYYSGDLWGDLTGINNNTSTNITDKYPLTPDQDSSSIDETDKDSTKANSQEHTIRFLVGLKNMGFRFYSYLKFSGTLEDTNNNNSSSDSIETTEQYTDAKNINVKNFNDQYNFSVKWGGMTFNSKETTIKPYAGIGVNIKYQPTITTGDVPDKIFDKTTNKYTTNTNTNEYEYDAYSSNTQLYLNGGSELVWGKDSNFMQVLDLSNDFYSNFYPSNIFKNNTKFDDFVTPENSYTKNTVTKAIGKVDLEDKIYTNYRFEYKPTEKLVLAGKAGLTTSFDYFNPGKREKTITKTVKTKDGNKTTVTKSFLEYNYSNGEYVTGSDSIISVDGKENEVSTYKSIKKKTGTFTTKFSPSFAIGLSYSVKPNFIVNLGYKGTIPYLNITNVSIKTKTTNTTYVNPTTREIEKVNTTDNNYSNVEVSTGAWDSSLSTGFVLVLGQYCNLDVAVYLNRNPSLNDLWSAGWNLGFSLKM